jgi:hypothetical protein
MIRSAEPGAPYFRLDAMLDGSSLFTIEGFEIVGSHRWQTGLQKAKPNQPCFSFCSNTRYSHAGNDERMVNRNLCRIGSTALAYEHFGRIIRGVGGVASGSGPGAFLSEILKKIRSHANRGRRRRNFEEWSRHRRAGPSHADIAIVF